MSQIEVDEGIIRLEGSFTCGDPDTLGQIKTQVDRVIGAGHNQLHIQCREVEKADLSLLQLLLYAQNCAARENRRFKVSLGGTLTDLIERCELGYLFNQQRESDIPCWGIATDHSLDRARVLIVDDSRTVRFQVRETLEDEESYPYQIEEREDGVEAMNFLLRLPDHALPDVMILDRNMPNMSGDEVAKLVKSDPRLSSIQILMLTAQSSVDEMIRGLSHLQVDDYISKPYNGGEFLARLNVLLRIRKAERQQQLAFEQLKETKVQLAETEAMASMTNLFEKFVPSPFLDHVKEGGIEQIESGLAEGKELTLLFSDIRSFTSLSEGRPPREVFSMLNEYYDVMQQSLDQHNGFIDKYIGDAIMAIFDGPNQAINAINAATQMHQDLSELNEMRVKRQEPPLAIGIGIHTGYTIIGTLGSKSRMDFTVIGDSVNLASRLEGLTKHYTCPLIVSRDTLLMVPFDQRPAHRMVDQVQVKGKEQPVIMYEMIDANPDTLAVSKKKNLEAFQKAQEAYQQQRWSDAVKLFTPLAKATPKDGLPLIYLKRAMHYQKNPPPEDWNGVFRMQSK